MARPLSRPKRWSKAVADAQAALDELLSLQSEYEDWQGNLPENFQEGALAEKLQGVADLDIQSARDAMDEAEGIDLPRGFGKD